MVLGITVGLNLAPIFSLWVEDVKKSGFWFNHGKNAANTVCIREYFNNE